MDDVWHGISDVKDVMLILYPHLYGITCCVPCCKATVVWDVEKLCASLKIFILKFNKLIIIEFLPQVKLVLVQLILLPKIWLFSECMSVIAQCRVNCGHMQLTSKNQRSWAPQSTHSWADTLQKGCMETSFCTLWRPSHQDESCTHTSSNMVSVITRGLTCSTSIISTEFSKHLGAYLQTLWEYIRLHNLS